MRLFATLGLAMAPFAVAVWSAFHWDALGAEGGVIWCAALLGGIVAVGVVAAWIEGKVIMDEGDDNEIVLWRPREDAHAIRVHRDGRLLTDDETRKVTA